MQPISLEEMDSVKLLNRVDNKYVIRLNQLPLILSEIISEYYVLTIDNRTIFGYESLYFDTKESHMFAAHHNGKLHRYKIRKREYTDSKLSFLEIKIKTNTGRTIKERISKEEFSKNLSDTAKVFIKKHTPYQPDQLEQKIATIFNRFTLVNKSKQERVTIDFNLLFKNELKEFALPNISIIEVKQNKVNKQSKLIEVLTKNKILPGGFSKYCYGTALLNETVKKNSFKPKILQLKKLENA